MKKIAIIASVCLGFIIFSIGVCEAAQCDNNAAPDLKMGDPACWTSRSSSWTQTCSWSRTGVVCDNVTADGHWAGSVFNANSCGDCPRARYNTCHGNYYVNSCGGTWCDNAGALPSAGTRTHTSTAHTCYYTTVDSWSVCDGLTGYKYANSVSMTTSSNQNCQNEETRQACPLCGIANGQGTGSAPTVNLCAPSNTASAAALNNNNWEWTCTAGGDSVSCSAPNSEDGECSAALSNHVVQAADAPLSGSDGLCDGGVYRTGSLTGNPNGPWEWTCDPIGPRSSATCSAQCFDYALNVNPRNFYWTEDGQDVEVTIDIIKEGACKGDYTCTVTVDGQSLGEHTGIPLKHNMSPGTAYSIVRSICTNGSNDVTKQEGVTAMCAERSCNAQGSCQTTPRGGVASIDECSSTCSSNADCSKGRIIETRP